MTGPFSIDATKVVRAHYRQTVNHKPDQPPADTTQPGKPTGGAGFSLPVRQPTASPSATASIDAGTVLTPAAGRMTPTALYIHVPFCFHKCHYCDFYSIVDTRDRQAEFTDRLIAELAGLAQIASSPTAPVPLQSIFVGGGTPSLLAVPLWSKLLQQLNRSFALNGCEFTVECNPETVTTELFDTLVAGGVNRVSIGAQSFNPENLKILERWHDPANVPKALDLARAAGISRQSIDLIYAIPGQSLAEWEHDLRTGLALGTSHISCYSLTYEPNTAMTARLKKGEFTPIDEDTDADMFESTLRLCRAAGLDRYEVSNFARPGDECRHNLAYWTQHNWLAAGPSASAHINGIRYKNSPRLDDYLTRHRDGFSTVLDVELPDPRRAVRERLMTGLRLRGGIDATELRTLCEAVSAHAREPLWDRLHHEAKRFVGSGHLVTDSRWQLTDSGFLIADFIAAELMRVVGF